MQNENPAFLDVPTVEVLKSDTGKTEAVLVRLQDPKVKAVRSVQPNSEVMVDFYLDSNDWPVSIVFHEPVFGLALVKTVDKIIHDAEGKPLRLASKTNHYFLTEKDVIAYVLRAFFMGLERHPSKPPPPQPATITA